MSLSLWGLIFGAIVSVLIGVLWSSGGAGVALLIPVFTLVLCPLGALVGWSIDRIRRHGRY